MIDIKITVKRGKYDGYDIDFRSAPDDSTTHDESMIAEYLSKAVGHIVVFANGYIKAIQTRDAEKEQQAHDSKQEGK